MAWKRGALGCFALAAHSGGGLGVASTHSRTCTHTHTHTHPRLASTHPRTPTQVPGALYEDSRCAAHVASPETAHYAVTSSLGFYAYDGMVKWPSW